VKLGLTLREEHRLRVFENGVLTTFGLKRDEVTGGWRKLHEEELHNLYSLSTIIKMITSRSMRLVGHVVHMGEKDTYRILVQKPEGKKPLERPRCRWEDNMITDLRER
jgi:hypothetical protein